MKIFFSPLPVKYKIDNKFPSEVVKLVYLWERA
jgi:hypothetical protein